MDLFGKTREKILEPIHNMASLAICALVVAFVALIVAVKK